MLQFTSYAPSELKNEPGTCTCIDWTEAVWDPEPPISFNSDGRPFEYHPRIQVRCLYCGRMWFQ